MHAQNKISSIIKPSKSSNNSLDPKKNALLWVKFVEGDMNAFKTLYNSHYQMLYNYGSKYLKTSEVNDCIHDTFLTILKYKNTTTDVKNVKAYLFRSFRNQIFKNKKNKKIKLQFIEGTIPTKEDDNINTPILKELKQLIEKLSPREREIVYLKYFQGFDNFEISELLEIKYQTVRNILANAIKKLRTLCDDFTHLLFILFSEKKIKKSKILLF